MSFEQVKQEHSRYRWRCYRLEEALARMDPSGIEVAREVEEAALREYPDLKARPWEDD